jgi:hypothetical protein
MPLQIRCRLDRIRDMNWAGKKCHLLASDDLISPAFCQPAKTKPRQQKHRYKQINCSHHFGCKKAHQLIGIGNNRSGISMDSRFRQMICRKIKSFIRGLLDNGETVWEFRRFCHNSVPQSYTDSGWDKIGIMKQ